MRTLSVALIAFVFAVSAAPAQAQTDFITFESGPVRPLALSPDKTRLFVCNTPDNTLEIFDVGPGGITRSGSVAVGMEPVAVAARTNTEVWVVNHLSDSISIVDVSGVPRVTRTLLVGDEPRDIVFAGSGGDRAFITTAHRGQNSPYPRGEYDVEGVGRADVWVFNANSLGAAMGGTPLSIVTLFGDKPRALAVSPDLSTVYTAVFRSGNQTTTLNEASVCDTSPANAAAETVEGPCSVDGVIMPGGYPPPHKNQEGVAKNETGLIVKLNRDGGTSDTWQDELGRDWSAAVRFELPDLDVFAISANANPPVETDSFAHVGTILFNMAVNPVSGKLYVSNTEARNEVRLEGFGTISGPIKPMGEPASVRGRLAESRITVIEPAGAVTPRHLNKHIDYSAIPQPAGAQDKSLSTPVGMDISADGQTLYLAAFGSGKIGVFDTNALENDTFVPDAADHITLSGGGPAGVVVDGDLLFTLTRFNNSVVVVDLTLGSVGTEIQRVPLHNPEPLRVINGRPFLYDAILTGSNGEASCASCHLFGDMDDLAWDLGDPDGLVAENTNPLRAGAPTDFHPIKGPMITQSLRGLADMGPQHWRGDRQGDAVQAFNAFNVAFPGLVGRDEGEFSAADMQKFTDFALEIRYPPNPLRQLDNSLRPDESIGSGIFFGPTSDTTGSCNVCHIISPSEGFFGADGTSTEQGTVRELKTPHLRNQYQKIGMFGMARTPRLPTSGDYTNQGPQVRGFGFTHDGSFDTVRRFFELNVFDTNIGSGVDIEAFMLVFDTDLPPIVGQQITKTSTSAATVDTRINDMITAAATPYPSKLLGPGSTQCDVVIKGTVGTDQISALLLPGGDVQPDDGSSPVEESSFRTQASVPGQELTYTCAPFGSGTRMALDRDGDGHMNRADNCADVPNPTQNDTDMNGIGNACEPGATTTTTTTSTTTTSTSTTTTTLPPPRPFITKTMKVTRLTKAAGEQRVKLKSEELDESGLVFDPPSQTVSLSIEDGASTIASMTLDPGDPDWSTNNKGNRFKWKPSAPPQADGLWRVTIKVRDSGYKLNVTFKDSDASAASAAASADVTFTVGDGTWIGTTPPCTLSGSGNSLRCK